jgi:hypothetical protein
MQPGSAGHLLQELRIARELEGLGERGREVVGLPDVVDADWLTCCSPARRRVLQCVMPLSMLCRVAFTMSATFSRLWAGFLPRPCGISHKPSSPCSAQRLRQGMTVLRLTENSSAMAPSG